MHGLHTSWRQVCGFPRQGTTSPARQSRLGALPAVGGQQGLLPKSLLVLPGWPLPWGHALPWTELTAIPLLCLLTGVLASLLKRGVFCLLAALLSQPGNQGSENLRNPLTQVCPEGNSMDCISSQVLAQLKGGKCLKIQSTRG